MRMCESHDTQQNKGEPRPVRDAPAPKSGEQIKHSEQPCASMMNGVGQIVRGCAVEWRKCAPLLIAAALTGCTTTRYSTAYCLTRAQLEQLKAQEPGKIHSQLNGDAAHDVGPLAGSAIRLRAYADGLLVVLGGCIDPNEGSRSK